MKGHSRNHGLDFYDCSLTSHMGKSFPNNDSGCSKTPHPVSIQATRFLRWMSTYCAHGWREENFKIFSTTTAQLVTVMERKSAPCIRSRAVLCPSKRKNSRQRCGRSRCQSHVEFMQPSSSFPKGRKPKSIWWQSSRVS